MDEPAAPAVELGEGLVPIALQDNANHPLAPGDNLHLPLAPAEIPNRPLAPGDNPNLPPAPAEIPNRPLAPADNPTFPLAPAEIPNRPLAPGEAPAEIPNHPLALAGTLNRTLAPVENPDLPVAPAVNPDFPLVPAGELNFQLPLVNLNEPLQPEVVPLNDAVIEQHDPQATFDSTMQILEGRHAQLDGIDHAQLSDSLQDIDVHDMVCSMFTVFLFYKEKELFTGEGCVEMDIPWRLCRTIGPLTLHSQEIKTLFIKQQVVCNKKRTDPVTCK